MIESFKRNSIVLACLVFVVIIAHSLNPFDSTTFSGHDETQAARIREFSYNLTQLQFPPRIAPHMSFGLGYPIFNYYAPTAYWITSLISLAGVPVTKALEVSYFLALLIGMIGSYLFFRNYFSRFASYAGAVLYVSSPVIAVDIFVRSNLAEIWFYALFPWALALLQRVSRRSFFITAVIVAALFSSHTIFSLVSIPILFIFAWIHKSRMQILAIICGILVASSFLIPALGELNQVQASQIAIITEYKDHFLCPYQLWYSPWGYGGSTSSCTSDGMSFMLGKVHILAGLGGIILFILSLLKKKKQKNLKMEIAMLILLGGSLFLTLSYSESIWKMFEPIMSIFQFPWRFLLFVILGLSFFGAYALNTISLKYRIGSSILLVLGLLILSPKFFVGQPLSEQEFNMKFASDEYIQNIAAFKVAEYLPITVNYDSWRQLETDHIKPTVESIGFQKYEMKVTKNAVLPIHYAPYWEITVDGDEFIPNSFDNLGQPRIKVNGKPVLVTVQYRQTQLENLANLLTLTSAIIALIYSQPHKWRIKKI